MTSAIAAAPVSGAGENPAGSPGFCSFENGADGERSDVCDERGRSRFGFSARLLVGWLGAGGNDAGVLGVSIKGNGSVCGVVARVVVAMDSVGHAMAQRCLSRVL